MFQELIQRTRRVPRVFEQKGEGEAVTRQVDIALLGIGFKLSADLFAYLAQEDALLVVQMGKEMLAAARAMTGDHVQHNTYFRDFPRNVPDTREFWLREIFRLLLTGETQYGRYQHSYEEMLAHHEAFLATAKDRVTLFHLGQTLKEEQVALYHSLAQSVVPLNDEDRALMKELARECAREKQPETIPVRETRAIINGVRFCLKLPVSVETLTDVLRLACALSDGDVTLQEATKFRSFGRPEQRAFCDMLNSIVETAPAQLSDIARYRERWKRLGERLYPHRWPADAHAREVFAVALGEKRVSSLEAQVEVALQEKQVSQAIILLAKKPGALVRQVDRLLRLASQEDQRLLCETLAEVAPKVSARVLLSLQEHLQNREKHATTRIFANSRGQAWVTPETREPLSLGALPVGKVVEEEIARRMPNIKHLVVDPAVVDVALPLSDKNKASGFGILPRGSVMPVDDSSLLRFFVYWKQAKERTDYDLSALVLDQDFQLITQISWTNLSAFGGIHSGDLTEAREGATEFIDLDLALVAHGEGTRKGATYLIPQINIFAGESFDEIAECFFGYMTRDEEQQGKPFEPATVRVKSDLRGKGKIALPLIFQKDEEGHWSAKWMHLYLNGSPRFNRVEANHLSTGVLARAIVEHTSLNVGYLVGLMARKADTFAWLGEEALTDHSTFIGLRVPDEVPAGCTVITLQNLHELIPA